MKKNSAYLQIFKFRDIILVTLTIYLSHLNDFVWY